MTILILEPYLSGSHAAWAEEYARASSHRVEILSLSGNFWKWRMHGGAVTLASEFIRSGLQPDLLLATDMLDLTVFLALTRSRTARIPAVIYFHENQIGYPWSPKDRDVVHRRDHHYGFINYSSALAADRVLFNSAYHRDSFLDELPRFLKHFPDHRGLENVEALRAKSAVLPIGVDLRRLDSALQEGPKAGDRVPLVLWNHRWEYDKNPDDFFRALDVLDERGVDFRVAILGSSCQQPVPVFDAAREKLAEKVVHFGHVKEFDDYARWLFRADILPVTSVQDFFGISVVQALYCGCYPLLPNRLVYPERVPAADHPEVFYSDFDDLVEKLAVAIQSIETLRQQNFRHCVARFDWGHMASAYDAVMEGIVCSRKRN
ncbi:DUF3524 domain-containing protein [candidate division KSB1 bacterium]|nr:DUF3524 domain-containing protein [candidate division KSB1 bacterium]